MNGQVEQQFDHLLNLVLLAPIASHRLLNCMGCTQTERLYSPRTGQSRRRARADRERGGRVFREKQLLKDDFIRLIK